MSFTDGVEPPQLPAPSSSPSYSTPSRADLAAVAATVTVVGVFMTVLIVWLIFRLRRAESQQQQQQLPIARRPTSHTTPIFRPSLAPSEASSKFSFIRKPLRLSRRQENTSWDFADPDPFNAHPKEMDDIQKHRPAPLELAPAYTPPPPRVHRASTAKEEPRTPITPDVVEPPPPAYCRDGFMSP